MSKLPKVFLIALTSLSLISLAGCADKKTTSTTSSEASSSSSSSSASSSSSSSQANQMQHTNATTIALATYNLMKSNGQLEQLNDDIEPGAQNVVEDTNNNKITFDAGIEQNDYFEQKAHITIDGDTVNYSTKQAQISVDDLYKNFSKTVSFHQFLDDFEIQDSDDNDDFD